MTSKASVLGDYLPTKLGMDEGETGVLGLHPRAITRAQLLFCFENGKVARVPPSAPTRPRATAGQSLTGAYSDKSPLVAPVCR